LKKVGVFCSAGGWKGKGPQGGPLPPDFEGRERVTSTVEEEKKGALQGL